MQTSAEDKVQQLEAELARMARENEALRRELAEVRAGGTAPERVLADALPAIVWRTDAADAVKLLNRTWVDYTGVGEAESIAAGVAGFVHPDDLPTLAAARIPSLETGETVTFEYRLRRADGAYRWHLARLVPEHDAEGRVRGWYGTATDVHDMKETEARLAAAEARTRAIIEQAMFSVQVLEPDGRTRSVNRAWERQWGLTLADLDRIGYNMLEDAQLEAKGIMAHIRRGFGGEAGAIPVIGYDTATIRPEGDEAFVRGFIYPVRDAEGAIREVVVMHQDVTAEVHAERALQAAHERLAGQAAALEREVARRTDELATANAALAEQRDFLRHVLDALPAAIGYADRDFVIKLVNQEYADAYGRPVEAFIGKPYAEVLPAASWVPAAPLLAQVRDTGETLTGFGVPRNAPGDSGEVFRDFKIVALPGPDGATAGILSFSTDATARVRAEQALIAQKALMERIVQHAPVIMAYFDAEMVYRWNNPLHCQLLGLPADRIVGRPLAEVMPPEAYARAEETFREVLATGEPQFGQMPPMRFPGRAAPASWDYSYVPVPGEDGTPQGVLVIAVESTDRVAQEQLREAQLAALQEADRAKDEFLSVISHELRTPLNFIMGFASTLEDEIQGPLNPGQLAALRKILNGADRMLMLVDDLLDYAKLQSGKLELLATPTAYAPLVDEAVGLMQPLAAQKGLDLMARVAVPGAPALDGPRVAQVLTNLVGNAIKFTPAGGRVEVRAFVRDGRLVTEVADTGLGIAEADLPKLFQRFRQLDMGATRQAGGTGLGLAIAKALVEAHGGEIGVESAPGRGSTFWFALPIGPP